MNLYKIENNFINKEFDSLDEWLRFIDFKYHNYISNIHSYSNGVISLYHYDSSTSANHFSFIFKREDNKHIFLEDLIYDIEVRIRYMKIDNLLDI